MITKPGEQYVWGPMLVFCGVPFLVGTIAGWPNGTLGLLLLVGMLVSAVVIAALDGKRDRYRAQTRH
jgi:hypothetical protein